MDPKAREPWWKEYANPPPGEAMLILCSLAARGLHREARRMMHAQGQPYGHLAFQAGTPLPVDMLARLVHATAAEVKKLAAELLACGAWGQTEAHVIYDPTLIAVKVQRDIDIENGRKGGNPNATGKRSQKTRSSTPRLTPPVNPPVNGGVGADQIRSDKIRGESARAQTDSAEQEGEEAPHIPSADEVVAFGQGPIGIPADYCREYHSKVSEKRRWLVRTSDGLELFDWQRELARWWVKDRAAYRPSEKPAADRDRTERLAEVRRLLAEPGLPIEDRRKLHEEAKTLRQSAGPDA